MPKSKRSNYLRLVAICFTLLLNFPILGIFNRQSELNGFPILYLYIFIVWLTIIILLYQLAERFEDRDHHQS